MKALLAYMKPHKKYVLLASIFMIADCICELVQPLLVAGIVDDGIQTSNSRNIVVFGIGMILLAIASLCFSVINARSAALAGVGFSADLRRGMFCKVQEFSFHNIDEFSTASLSTRMTNDLTIVQNAAIMSMRILLKAPVMFIVSFVMALVIKPSLSTILLIVIPLLLISLYFILSRSRPRFEAMQQSVDHVNADVQETLTNVRVVKSFVRQKFEKIKFSRLNDQAMENGIRAMNLVVATMPLMMLLMNLCTVAVLWFGGRMVMVGSLNIGMLTAYINYITHILMSLMILAGVFMQITRASASADRITEVLNKTPDLNDREVLSENKISRGKVEFKNVSFQYNEGPGKEVLTDISFTAQPGQIVAIIGGTGAGKTSLVQLIPRLYDVTAGSVLVDDTDVRDYPKKALRDAVGMVLQNNTLFSGTIAENLRWGNENASDEELIEAAKAAQAHDFISSFPDGYQTHIEQGGVNVSGGQKQRLCIARAILKNPVILILDDSTSAVDTATEQKIRQSFRSQLQNTTILIIAQRISSVMNADKIVIVDNGRIAGEGTHQELLAGNTIYQDIYNSQMDANNAEGGDR